MNQAPVSRKHSRLVRPRLIAVGLAALIVIILSRPAAAVDPTPCHKEQQIFVRDQGDHSAHGVSGLANAHYRDNNGCIWDLLSPNVHDAIHLVDAQNSNNFVEAGYIQHYVPGPAGDAVFNTFAEAHFGGAGWGPSEGVFLENCYTYGCGDLGLKVQHLVESGDSGWRFYDKIVWAGGDWDSFAPRSGGLLSTGFNQGVPMGETSRRGGDDTGMRSHWTNLKSRADGTGTWNPWDDPIYKNLDNYDNPQQWPCGPGQTCYAPPNWHPCTKNGSPDYPRWIDSSLSKDEYKVVKNTVGC